MARGYKSPSFKGQAFEQLKKSAMSTRTSQPKSGQKGIAGIPSIPAVRPTTMRNLAPWSGFKPGKN